ncbi:MAG TPA: NAD(P)-dependent oxidoreductase [Chloroflexota bacterium]|jgi:nucleoside-diphosphate-sugar epimerase|nr:NAD(P)-dependent oxidoreductase [Chloroflexota bacterium]
MRVLITGGCGNLGRYTADELAAHGHQPVLFDRKSPQEVPLPFATEHPFIRGELTSGEDVRRAVEEAAAEAIVHLGAIPHATDHPATVARAREQGGGLPEDETFRVNLLGTYYVLDAARRAGVRRIAAASSFFVLGLGFRISQRRWDPAYLPIDEAHPNTPEDSYSLSKLLNEEMLAAYSRAWGLRTIALRLLGVSYPHRERDAQPERFGQLAPPGPATGVGNFTAWMYLDGRDGAQAFRLAIEKDDLPQHDVFFVATDSRLSEPAREAIARVFPHLADAASRMAPHDLPISIEKARRVLGYEPRHSWRTTSAAPGRA